MRMVDLLTKVGVLTSHLSISNQWDVFANFFLFFESIHSMDWWTNVLLFFFANKISYCCLLKQNKQKKNGMENFNFLAWFWEQLQFYASWKLWAFYFFFELEIIYYSLFVLQFVGIHLLLIWVILGFGSYDYSGYGASSGKVHSIWYQLKSLIYKIMK